MLDTRYWMLDAGYFENLLYFERFLMVFGVKVKKRAQKMVKK
jgi:hypothetical protein